MQGAIKGRLICDRQGKIWAERDADVIDNLSSSVSNALDISKNDWIERPTIQRTVYRETAFIEMGGIAYDFSSSQALLADAPGTSPAYHGKVERVQGLALTGQAQLNTMIGNLFAARNAEFPEVEYRLRSAWWNLDIVPMDTVSVTLDASESNAGFVWTNKKFVIQGITWNINSKDEVAYPVLNVKEVTQGFDGATVTIPPVPPTEGTDGGTYDVTTPTTVPSVPTVFSVSIYDDHVLKGTASALDFIGAMLLAAVSGTTASITVSLPVYHNDAFVGNAQALNFLDSGYTSTGTS
jgi:hypothetical protein